VSAPLGTTVTNTANVTVPAGIDELDPSDNSDADSDLVSADAMLLDGFE
jgi:hypothetical protein